MPSTVQIRQVRIMDELTLRGITYIVVKRTSFPLDNGVERTIIQLRKKNGTAIFVVTQYEDGSFSKIIRNASL